MPMVVVMRIVYCLFLIVCGVLAVSGMVLRKRPDAARVLGQLIPFQGILGIVLGIWSLILAIRLLDMLILSVTFGLVIAVIATVVGVILGFILAYGLLYEYVLNKNASGVATTKTSLVALQSPFGIAAIVFGIAYLIVILV